MSNQLSQSARFGAATIIVSLLAAASVLYLTISTNDFKNGCRDRDCKPLGLAYEEYSFEGTTDKHFAVRKHFDKLLSLQNSVKCWANNGSWAYAPDTAAELHTIARIANDTCCPIETAPQPFRWLPDGGCSPLKFKRFVDLVETLLPILERNRLLLVGDSMTRNLKYAMQRRVFLKTGQNFSDYADFTRSTNLAVLHRNRGANILDGSFGFHLSELGILLESYDRYRIIILNSGLHYRNDTEFLRGFTDAFDVIRKRQPNALVFVRSTPVGVSRCQKYWSTAPLTPAEADVLWQPKNIMRYNWDKILPQNQLLERMLREKYQDYVVFLDVLYATSMRPDSHRVSCGDCLHYCDPGAPDMWADVIANAVILASQLGLVT